LAFNICSNTVFFDSQVVKVKSGTTAQRDALVTGTGLVQGATWWNTSSESFNVYDGVNWKNIGPVNEIQGLVWSWGQNTSGKLGDNTTVNKSSPVSVVGEFTDWCQISAGCQESLAVRRNGTAWGWGANNYGQLGDNTTVSKSSPVSVIGGFTDWCQVSGGGGFSLAIRQNGTAWAWGYNYSGRLGNNTITTRSSPVSVVGGFTNWCQISASIKWHSLAVRQNGTAWAWGNNSQGQLGDNTTVNKSSPVSVIGGFTDWCQVAAGRANSLGVRQNGTAWSWGCNRYGQLGNNSTNNQSSPVSVVGGFTDWCQISAGYFHSQAVRQNGTAWGWGDNNSGRLGSGEPVDCKRSSPVSVVGGFTNWCQISAGQTHSLAVRQNGSAWGWGNAFYGQLGINCAPGGECSPVSVVGGFVWCQVSAGVRNSLGLRERYKQ
jgi:alpha-tubulin suppressor-like RCC1 family protein